MEQISAIDELRAWRRQQSGTLAFVPTMGALHAGHMTLIERARSEGDLVVVSIFVNPIQFDNPDDLYSYPQTLAADLEACESAGVDLVFLPQREDIYPNGYATFVEVVGPLSDKLCGAARPGHFRGVTTVVTKLFNMVQPDVAVFGEKDLQQALLIQRMVQDLAQPVEIIVSPTVRDDDGLPLSSRNSRLSGDGRFAARALPRGLAKAAKAFLKGERTSVKLMEIVYEELLVYPGVEVDYADVVRVRGFEETSDAAVGDLLAVAVFVEGVRLIDHLLLGTDPLPVDLDPEE